jgi:hypothetical protein
VIDRARNMSTLSTWHEGFFERNEDAHCASGPRSVLNK